MVYWTRRKFMRATALSMWLPPVAFASESQQLSQMVTTVLQSQKAGFESNNWEAYIEPWSRKAQWVAKRLEDDPQYEIILHYDAVLARMKLLAKSGGAAPKMTHVGITPSIDPSGEKGTVKAQTTLKTGTYSETIGEIYRLRKEQDAWRITHNTYWLRQTSKGARTTTYNTQYFLTADKNVLAAKTKGPLESAIALCHAMRWSEAHHQLHKLTNGKQASANTWALRAHAAFMLGDTEDAIASVTAARAVKADIPLPSWASGLVK